MSSLIGPGSLECYYHLGRYCFKSRGEFTLWLAVVGCALSIAIVWSIVDWRKKRR